MQLEFIGEKRHFEVGYKEKLKHFPKLEARKLRIDFDSRGDQITNKTKLRTKQSKQRPVLIRPAHHVEQTVLTRLSHIHAKNVIFRYFSENN